MKKENLLLIIDMQNDFCLPNGALYVDGAEHDVQVLCNFIHNNLVSIDEIVLTRDNHNVIDISHPAFWRSASGDNPKPFTQITPEDIQNKKWVPLYFENEAMLYVESLYKQGEYPHVIWPEHCIAGSNGAAIADELMEVLKAWSRQGRFFEVYRKGQNPLTEHFGALRANIPIAADVETQLNAKLIDKLKAYKNIFIAGEAKSHCVANTVKQIGEIEGLTEKLIILEDAMSNVAGFEHIADSIYDRARERGARFETTDVII